MDIEEIKKLIKLVEKSGIRELEVEEGGKKVRISKYEGGEVVPRTPVSYAPMPAHHVIPPAQASPVSPEEAGKSEAEEKYHLVKSPMVGTFYMAPAEDAAPFVKEGDVVSAGQTLCIIEAMKLMNEIESDVSGRVVKILPENGAPVEYGETLFKVEPL
ncbi:MAG: acetyl-CoA carboxylase biotin carboxyl carrier protein [Nitrospinae bacterium]|nr:acetyl-CoA carboxylase biotin carboxyl carrier protein [Nitrospinota bacterium]